MRLYDEAPLGATSRARTLRRNQTDAEKRLWHALREALPHHKWRRQVPIGPYVADFMCVAAGLIVEADGGQHTPEQDAARSHYLTGQGFRVIRFWNNDVLANMPGVLESIAEAVSKSPSPHGRGRGPRRAAAWEGEAPVPAPISFKQRTSPQPLSQGGEGLSGEGL